MNEITLITSTDDTTLDGGGVAQVVRALHLNSSKYVCSKVICKKAWVEKDDVLIEQAGHDLLTATQKGESCIVHSHGIWDFYSKKTCDIALAKGVPLVISPHGMLEPWAMRHKKYKKKVAWHMYQNKLIKKAHLLIVNSVNEYESVRKIGFKNPVAILGNGVDRPISISKTKFKDRDKTILFLSRISEVKGIPDLIYAWSLIEDLKGYQLHLCGNGDDIYIKEIIALIDKLGVASTVKFLGPIFGDEKWAKFESSHLFVLPSYSENFGIVIAEALNSGLPVLTTHAAPWKSLEQENIGWSIDNCSIKLAEKITDYINLEPSDKKRLCLDSRSYSENRFEWTKVFQEYLDCYHWVLGWKESPPSSIRFD